MQFCGWQYQAIGIGKFRMFAGFLFLRVMPTRILFSCGAAENRSRR